MGQFRKSDLVTGMSVLPSRADVMGQLGLVRKVQEPAVSNCGKTAHLFNNLVGSVQQAQWHVEAKRICRSQVDD